MIKSSLIRYIEQFSLKRTWQEFNTYFWPALGITLGSIFLTYVGLWVYGQFLSHSAFWKHADFLEVVGRMVEDGKHGGAKQFTFILSFNLMLMTIVKMRRTGQIQTGALPPQLLQSYGIGLLITFVSMIVLGDNLDWLLNFGKLRMGGIQLWLYTIIKLTLPCIIFFLAFYFLKRGLNHETRTTWTEFLSIVFIYLLVSTFIGILTVIFTTIIMQPVLMVFALAGGELAIGLAFVLVVLLLSFYMVIVSDLLLVMVNQKTGEKPVPKSNPDLLDA